MADLIHGSAFLWLFLITLHLVARAWRRRQNTRALSGHARRVSVLRERRAELEALLPKLQSADPAERIAAARELIRKRAQR